MSKMSQIHSELSEQASELGFESIAEAEANGYHITYTDNGVKLALDMSKQLSPDEAYKQRKEEMLNKLDNIIARVRKAGGIKIAEELKQVEEYIKWA